MDENVRELAELLEEGGITAKAVTEGLLTGIGMDLRRAIEALDDEERRCNSLHRRYSNMIRRVEAALAENERLKARVGELESVLGPTLSEIDNELKLVWPKKISKSLKRHRALQNISTQIKVLREAYHSSLLGGGG
jgi:hypothetical protein